MALGPHANHVLISVRCLTCEKDHDLAVWTIDQQGWRWSHTPRWPS